MPGGGVLYVDGGYPLGDVGLGVCDPGSIFCVLCFMTCVLCSAFRYPCPFVDVLYFIPTFHVGRSVLHW